MSDPVIERIVDAVSLLNAGKRQEARETFTTIWSEIAATGDPFHACVLSHYMADAQDDPLEELMWDKRALAAADRIVRERPDASGLSVLSMYPSLHASLADVMHRTGDISGARKHLQLAEQTSGALSDDSYGRMIRSGIERLARELG